MKKLKIWKVRLKWTLRNLLRRLRTLDPQTEAEKKRLLRLIRLLRRILSMVILLLRALTLIRELIRLLLRNFQRSGRN